MYVHLHACMYARMHAFDVCMCACTRVHEPAMYACIYVCMNVTSVCVSVCTYIRIRITYVRTDGWVRGWMR